MLALQAGAVWCFGSQTLPTLVPETSQVPDAAPDGVTQNRPAPQGWSRPHAAAAPPNGLHCCVAATHSKACEHEVVAEGSPALFGGAQMPQLVPVTIAQLLLW